MRGETTIGKIINDDCDIIWEILQPQYMPIPTKDDWLHKSKRFLELWNLPNCIGAIDGKHIRLKKPINSGSSYFNYKEFFSINLMACVDADGLFTSIDVGDYGRSNDSGVFRRSALGLALSNKTLNIPDSMALPGEEEFDRSFDFYFVADEAFPLSTNIMRPFNSRVLNNDRRIFNYRLSRGRNIVECAFGMLASKFRIFQTPISTSVDKAVKIVKTACLLHNFIKINEKNRMTSTTENVTANTNIQNLDNQRGRPTDNAIENREYLCQYFQKPYGSVPWQYNFI